MRISNAVVEHNCAKRVDRLPTLGTPTISDKTVSRAHNFSRSEHRHKNSTQAETSNNGSGNKERKNKPNYKKV